MKNRNAENRKQEDGDIQITASQTGTVNILETLPRQPKLDTDNRLEEAEKNVILLLLKHGMYEIDVEEIDENNETYYTKSRVDQYIFNELHNQNLKFSYPLFQIISFEYSLIAISAQNQDEIKYYFSMIDDKEITNFVISNFINEPEISELWNSKHDIITRSANNNINNLNTFAKETILTYILRTLEEYQKLFSKEIVENSNNEEYTYLLLEKLNKLLKRREIFANLNKVVISF
jgi:hypothetical protein